MNPCTGRLALAAAMTVLCASVSAAPLNLSAMTPQQVRQLANRMAAGSQPVSPQYNLDIKAPVLRGVSVKDAKVVINGFDQTQTVRLKVVDGVTGVRQLQVSVRHVESGQQFWGSRALDVPAEQLSIDVGTELWAGAPSGRYVVDAVAVADANGNLRRYDEAALAAMGNTGFEVINRFRSDAVPPSLQSGQVLTPVVSMSAPPKGEYPGNPARVALALRVSDSGVDTVSGASFASVSVCDADRWNCLYLSGTADLQGQALATVRVGAQLNPGWLPAGTYSVTEVYVRDRQGNARAYYEWDTDFNALFGGAATLVLTD